MDIVTRIAVFLILVLMVFILHGCKMHAGFAFHPENELNENDSNPLGIVRFQKDTLENTQLFCEHTSSVPDDDHGLNMCGILWRVK